MDVGVILEGAFGGDESKRSLLVDLAGVLLVQKRLKLGEQTGGDVPALTFRRVGRGAGGVVEASSASAEFDDDLVLVNLAVLGARRDEEGVLRAVGTFVTGDIDHVNLVVGPKAK